MSEYLFKTDKEIMTCQECPIVKRYGLSTICPLREGAERKYGTCPLKEVPTHGNLVDRDFIIDNGLSLREAPTVIEASEERK